MIELLAGPLYQAIGLALMHLLWQGALIAAFLFVTLRLVRDSDVRYTAACAALTAMMMFGIATAYRVYEPPLSRGAFQPMAGAQRTAPPILDMTLPANAVSTPSITDVVLNWTRVHAGTIVLAWLLGVLVLTIRLGVSWRRARAVVRRFATPAVEWQTSVSRLSAALGIRRAITVLESAAVEVPSVVGWLRPVILLPVSTLTGLTPQQLEMVLAHELAHVRRHDFLVNVLQSVVETLLFYHPAAWWISRQIRIERENCCDDLAVAVCGNALQYARALTMLEQMRSTPTMGVAATGGSLIERIRRLVVHHTDRSSLITGWTALAAAASFALLLTITSVPAMADREEKAPTRPETKVTVRAPRARTPKPQPVIAPTPAAAAYEEAWIDAQAAVAPLTPLPPMPPAEATMAMAAAIADGMDFNFEFEGDDQDSQKVGTAGKLSIDDLIALRVAGVTPQYMDEMRRVFGDALTLKEISNLKMHGVTAAYVSEMRSLFGPQTTARDVSSLQAMGITAKWLQEMRAAGVEVKTAREATSLAAVGVTPAFVRSLAEAGYPNLTARDLSRLAANGINADFIREIAKYREKK